MNQNQEDVTVKEAEATLESLNSIKSMVHHSTRPPLWLNAMGTFFLGLLTFSMAWSGHENLWFQVSVFCMVGLVGSYAIWFRLLYIQGLVPRYSESRQAQVLMIARNLVYLLLLLGSRELYQNGMVWAPFAAAMILCTSFALDWHKYPTNRQPRSAA